MRSKFFFLCALRSYVFTVDDLNTCFMIFHMLCSKGARTFPVPFAKKKHSTLKKTESYTRSSMHESITFLVWSSNLQAFGALKKGCVQTPINFTCHFFSVTCKKPIFSSSQWTIFKTNWLFITRLVSNKSWGYVKCGGILIAGKVQSLAETSQDLLETSISDTKNMNACTDGAWCFCFHISRHQNLGVKR